MRRRTRAGLLSILLLGLVPFRVAFAQEAAPAPGADPAPAVAVDEDLLLKTMAMDIASADYYALVAWARELGLPESGDASELRKRLYDHYDVEPPAPAASAKRTVTIESADSSQYLSAREGVDSSVLFTGRVSIVIKDDEEGQTITLKADEVLFNRDANLLSARGNVAFERKRADGSDFFMGETLELDLDDNSGLFLDGQSSRGEGKDRLIFRADDIVSKGAGVLVFKDGEISSCEDDPPHYSIRASKVWILGGNEWAMLNATLSVGELPVLYLPFFYYPGEEIAFHPVFGYDNRNGRFMQTTTYLLGEKSPKEESISLFRLTEGSAGYEREVRGVFLRTTDAKKESAGNDFIKVFADIYTGLGAFAGGQAKIASLGDFQAVDGFFGLGVSRSLFYSNGIYSPFADAGDYLSVWNSSYFLGARLPLRFGLEFATRLSLGPLGVSLSLPLYGDPYFERDFRNRSEDMAWLKFLSQDEPAAPPGKRSSFVDKIDAQLSVPSSLLPAWISSISLSKLSSSLSWVSKSRPVPVTQPELTLYNEDPSREFFYPEQLTYLDAAGTLSGTIFSYPAPAAASGAGVPQGAAAPGESSWRETVPDLIPPWAGTEAGAPAGERPAETTPAADIPEALPDFVPPGLAVVSPAQDPGSLRASLAWQLAPSGRWDRRFKSAAWLEPGDVDWSPSYELYNARLAGSLTFSAEAWGGLVSTRLGLSGSTQAQERPLADDPSPTVLDAWAYQDAQYRNDRLSAAFQLKGTPFLSSWLWSASSVSYNLDASLYDYTFQGMVLGVPTYAADTFSWDADRIKTHSLGVVLSARPLGFVQSLSVQASLPPLTDSYSGRLDLSASRASMSVQARYYRSVPSADFSWSPISARLSLGAAPLPSLVSTFIWDMEESRPTSLSTRLTWDAVSLDLNFRRALAYDLTLLPSPAWVPAGAEEFRPAEVLFGFLESWSPPPAWKNRISWSLKFGANARQSFLRFTDSSLDFTTALTFKVYRFLDITLSSTSRNSALWRYYPGAFNLPSGIGLEPVNPIVDIARSFNFFDTAEREQALFKLKSLSLKAVHQLHDWDLTLDFSVSPILATSGDAYEFRPSFSVLLAWRGVPEIKSAYKLDGTTETWE